MNTTIIPFNIKSNTMNCKGEAIGNDLENRSLFKVAIKGQEPFYIQAIPDNELPCYEWTSYLEDDNKRLVPIIGKIIERYYSRTK